MAPKCPKYMKKIERLHLLLHQLPTEGSVRILKKNSSEVISQKYLWNNINEKLRILHKSDKISCPESTPWTWPTFKNQHQFSSEPLTQLTAQLKTYSRKQETLNLQLYSIKLNSIKCLEILNKVYVIVLRSQNKKEQIERLINSNHL